MKMNLNFLLTSDFVGQGDQAGEGRPNQADDCAGGRGADRVRQPGQHAAAIRGGEAECQGQAGQRSTRVSAHQAAGARGEHGRDQEHAHLHVQVRLCPPIQVI
jgi:hypothetical protein